MIKKIVCKAVEDAEQFQKMIEMIREQPVVCFSNANENTTLVIDHKKWNPCPFCRSNNRIPLAFDGYNDAISIVTDNNAASIESDSFGFLIEYCPKCGQPLTEQAWQELERRIFDEVQI